MVAREETDRENDCDAVMTSPEMIDATQWAVGSISECSNSGRNYPIHLVFIVLDFIVLELR